jgi:two-component system, cell cycle sensor histidine kinase and response regulator CckA
MSVEKKDRLTPWTLVFIFLFLLISIFITAFFYYQFQQKRIVSEKQDELKAIADLKIWQISRWRNERIIDAETVFENALAARQIKSYLQSSKELNRRDEILSWLRSFLKNNEYRAVYLLDASGTVRLSGVPYADSSIIRAPELVKEAIGQKKIVFSDFRRTTDSSKIYLALVAPLLNTQQKDTSVIGAVMFCIDPNQSLFPLIQLWPTPSHSSETLLIERDSNDVLFLNELRHLKNSATVLRMPITNEQLPAAMAARGIEGIVEGTDYRGIPVLAAIKRVPGSPWRMVSKVDQEEVYASLRFQFWVVGGIMIILILASGSVLGFWWRNLQEHFYHKQYQAKVERLALLKHFEYLMIYTNDILVLANEKLEIVEVNDRALEVYGYSHEEILNLKIDDLQIIQADDFSSELKREIVQKGATFESIHRRKDGRTFPTEYSVHLIEIEGKKFYQGIIRDITARKEAEEVLRESEEKFRTFAEQSPNMIFINKRGRVVYANAQCEEIMGYSKEEFYSPDFDFADITAPEYVELLKDYFGKHLKGEEVPAYEYAVITKQGRRIEVIITTKLIPYENDKAILGIITDITERKRAEESLVKFRLGLERSSDAVFITDPSGIIIYVNPAFEHVYGYSYQESIGRTPRILKSGILTLENYQNLWNTLLSKKVVSGEIINKTKDGRLIHIEGTNNPILDHQGTIIGFLGIHRDITVRKREEEKQQQSFSLIQATLESTADGILVVDRKGSITNYNNQFIKMWNIPENIMAAGKDREALNFVLAQLKSPKDFIAKVNELYSHPDEESFDVLEFKTGKIFERYSRPQRIEGRPVGRVWSFRDVTQRKLAEDQLQESEERYRRLVEYSPYAIAVHIDGKFVFVNPAAVKLLGATSESQIVGQSVLSVIHPDDVEAVRQRVLLGISERKALPPMEEKIVRMDGSVIEAEVTSLPIVFQGKPAIQIVTRDITEQKKLQDQVFQSQKIQSLGTLAGGIAHDFNNILAIILGYSSILDRNKKDPQKHAESITAINQAIERGAALVRQILTFARKTDIEFELLHIPDIVHELLSMLKETFSKTISFTQTYSPDLPEILADRTQIHQTLLNLCVNARDAMPNGGSIIIKAERQTRSEVSKRFSLADQDSYVCISVADNGTGMDEATYNRAFDPFFTTKEKGKGTGLGLSVVYGVMQAHHGFVDAKSRVGEGTTFYLYFPASPAAGKQNEETTSGKEKPIGGTETILLIEDEYLLLKATRQLLKSFGYSIYVAANGEEALEVFARHRNEIDLVLTDIGLPKISGIDVFNRLKELDPSVKVILASGFFEPDIRFSLQRAGAKGFVQKPYLNDEVLRIIREVLDEKNTL